MSEDAADEQNLAPQRAADGDGARVLVVDRVGEVDVGEGTDPHDATSVRRRRKAKPRATAQPGAKGNYISEWFGHRVYPTVRDTATSRADQKASRCPFLTAVKGEDTACIKDETALGVCTVSSASNRRAGKRVRQDWLVCEYRAFDPALLRQVAARLYGEPDPARLAMFGAITTRSPGVRREIFDLLAAGERRVLLYFDEKVGGEIKIPPTERTPSLSFDVTMLELLRPAGTTLPLPDGAVPEVGRYAVLELQTMDYHGSYGKAVGLMVHARDEAFEDSFPQEFARKPEWLAKKVSTPNIGNVFKRTIHQMLFKFPLGAAEECAGTALAVPRAVWDSWQRFLARPPLVSASDGTLRLEVPADDTSPRAPEASGVPAPAPTALDAAPSSASDESGLASSPEGKVPSWIVVFDFDADAPVTPSPIRVTHIIGTSAAALAHYAYVAAPREVARDLAGGMGVQRALRTRLGTYWPALGLPESPAGKGTRERKRRSDAADTSAISARRGPKRAAGDIG